ncbi:MAG TPA: M1 family metallopeptidase [Polyangiaceae bacterium]
MKSRLLRSSALVALASAPLFLGCSPEAAPPAKTAVAKTTATPTTSGEAEPASRPDGRLPATASPLKYELKLDVDPAQNGFRGIATIGVHVPKETSYLVLNARDIKPVRVAAEIGKSEVAGTWTTRKSHGATADDELVLHFPQPIPAGDTKIQIAYEAPFGTDLAGLYKVTDGGKPYAFTQFEATDARRAFPCFDEPAYKVPFDVSVRVPKGQLAVANGPEVKRVDEGDKTTFTFGTTQPLPTYLVAFAVGDFDVREGRKSPFPIRLITTKGKSTQGTLALEASAALVDRLQNYFGIPYPYPKLDIVAVPDFAAGAMENAGLVTFREELLLLPPENVGIRAKHIQAAVIAHEFAHQWFGDLVTMQWWDDIWLNEAFASWMEAKTLDGYQPSYDATLDMVSEGLSAMRTDALSSARAVRQPVTTAGEADEAFDDLTYNKGAAVIGMIEDYVGADTFRNGVRAYLKRHSFKNAQAKDLFAAIDETHGGGDDVARIAGTFLDQTGFPTISLDTKCDGKSYTTHVTQSVWKPIGSQANTQKTWIAPLSIVSDAETPDAVHHFLLAGKESATDAYPVKSCPKFVTPNAHQAGYFRFQVPDKELVPLMKAKLDPAARMGLVANSWANIQSATLDPSTFLAALKTLDGETNRFVVASESDVLSQMNDSVVDDANRKAFTAFVEARLGPVARKLGWQRADLKKAPTPAEEQQALLRRDVMYTIGNLGQGDALTQSEKIAQAWLKDPTTVDPDTAPIALEIASRKAKADRFDALRNAYVKAPNPQVRVAAVRAMGGFGDPALLQKALDWAMTDEVKEQDVRYVLRAALVNPASRKIVLDWTKAHWDAALKKEPGAGRVMYLSVVGNLCEQSTLDDAKAFFGSHMNDIEGGQRPFAEDLERASNCIALRAAQAPAFDRAFGVAKAPAAAPTPAPKTN